MVVALDNGDVLKCNFQNSLSESENKPTTTRTGTGAADEGEITEDSDMENTKIYKPIVVSGVSRLILDSDNSELF